MSDPGTVHFLIDLMAGMGEVHARRMFGGYGIFCGKIMFGLVADDVLYLKADDHNMHQFLEAGLEPFIYMKKGRPVTMSYYEAPAEAMDDSETMERWAKPALHAAQRAKGRVLSSK